MNHSASRLSRRRLRSQPAVECLDARLLLSGDPPPGPGNDPLQVDSSDPSPPPSDPLPGNLSILAVDPASGSTLSQAPSAITVTFDRPIDPFSLGSDDDFDLFQVAPDGTETSIYYAVNPSPTESLNDAGDQLTLALNRQLGAGQYHLIIRQTSMLAGLDGSQLTGAGSDITVDDFTIAAQGVTPGDAIDLGTPTSVPREVSGSLDLGNQPAAVSLYKVTLPPGHFWRLGLEVTAQRDGGSLDSALALFNNQGQPIATDEFGRSDFPLDPYLFAGLAAGTYFVGVSGAGNLPGANGGYDLASGTPGSLPQNQSGGPFVLHVVADPVDSPPILQSFTIDHADPLDPDPTGFTLAFSRAIRENTVTGSLASTLSAGVELVDGSGKVWPVVGSGFSEADAKVSYLFLDRLPAGQYSVRLPEQNGLVDLAGLAPVAPGQPQGTLGSFTVSPSDPTVADPHDLGILLPDVAARGVQANALLNAGQSETYRVVVTFAGFYRFETDYAGQPLTIRLSGPAGTVSLDPGSPGMDTGGVDEQLAPGVYQETLTAAGTEPVLARLSIRAPSVNLESLLENGVGQGPGLALRLIQPIDVSATEPGPTGSLTFSPGISLAAVSAPSGTTAGTVLPRLEASAGNPSASASSTASLFPPSVVVTLGGNLVGRPLLESDLAAPQGQGLNLSEVASLSGPGQGWNPVSPFLPQPGNRGAKSPWDAPAPDTQPPGPPTSGAIIAADLPSERALTTGTPKDEGLLARLEMAIADWFQTGGRGEIPGELDDLPRRPDLVGSAEKSLESGGVEEATLSSPLSLAVLASLVLQNRLRLGRPLSKKRRSVGRLNQASR